MASLLRNVATNLLGFVAGKAAAAVTGIVLLRVLRPEAAGIYGAALGFAALFQSLADLGLSACLTKEVGAHPKQASAWFSRGLQAQALQVLVSAVGMLLFLHWGGAKGVEPSLVLLAFSLTSLASLSAPVLAVLQGLEKFALQGVLETSASLLNAAALAAVILWGYASPVVALQASLGAALLGAGLRFYGARRAGLRIGRQPWAKVLLLWKQSLPFAMVSVTNQLYVRVDQALLAWMIGTGPLGFYFAAVKVVDLMVPVLGALNGPLYARLAGLHGKAAKGDKAAKDQAWGNLNRALRYMALICVPLGVGGTLLAGPLVRFLYGPDFGPAQKALAWLVWIPALIGVSSCLLHGLNAVGRTLRLAQLFGVNLILNIGLNLWFIPKYGIAASAAISALCESINLSAAWWLARRAGLAPSLKMAFWPALPAALGMAGVLWVLRAWSEAGALTDRWAAPFLIGAGILSYVGFALLFGFLGSDERAQLARVLKRA